MEILREEPSTSKKRMVMATTAAFSEMLPGCCTREKYSKHKEFVPFIDTYHPNTFTAMFRMTRSTFDSLLGAICMDEIFLKQNSGGMEMTAFKDQLLMFLWYAATQDNFIRLADRFGVCTTTATLSVDRIGKAIINNLKHLIKWPSRNEAKETMLAFSKNGLTKKIGSVDGSHIPIKKPFKGFETYYNRKGFYSINLQEDNSFVVIEREAHDDADDVEDVPRFAAICDHRLAFIDIYYDWPGSAHDSKVFQNSGIAIQIEESPETMCPDGSYILGDSAYPLSATLLTPYKKSGKGLNPVQRHFNYVLSSTRVIIERAFGLLKGKFQRLNHIEMDNVANINQRIYTCIIIHNFCIFHKEDNSFVVIEREAHDDADDVEDVPRFAVGSRLEDYQAYRDKIAEELYLDSFFALLLMT
ncbi:putative nuclease HARBI1 [Clytia hemisphaerica]|uniref:putative nuclease HARBI1 n=1 Tax=Clytia hemisphaerica TaxID=252671 RepID=UPI0034D4FD31